MHFISTGRNERIRRWILEQKPVVQDGSESDKTPKTQDEAENELRREHDARSDMSWDIEELEREMALTAYAFGKINWRISVQSVDLTKLDFPTLKRLSQLTVQGGDATLELPGSRSSLDKPRDSRRNGRIVSEPPEIPPSPNIFDEFLPQPMIQRSVPAPPPISTSAHSSRLPPIAFVLQESSSPQANTMHFTPTSLDMDAFPSTPRSFNSFFQRNSRDRPNIQELFFSPRLQHDPTNTNPNVQALSPDTPYSCGSCSELSTPSLSAFPATPASSFPNLSGTVPWKSDEAIPPVPDLPPLLINGVDSSAIDLNRDKDLPPAPKVEETREIGRVRSDNDGSMKHIPQTQLTENLDMSHPELADDNSSEVGTDVSVGEMSSRYSVFSSHWSLSSLGSEREPRGKWSQFQFGKGSSKSRADSTRTTTTVTSSGKRNHGRSRSNSSAAFMGSHSRNASALGMHSRTESRTGAHSRSGSRIGVHARTDSSLGMHSSGASRTGTTPPLSRSNSASRIRNLTPTISRNTSLTRNTSLSRKGSLSAACPPIQEQPGLTPNPEERSFLSMQDDEVPEKTKKKKMRDIMSRLSLKKSKSAGVIPSIRPRPPRSTPPLPLASGNLSKAQTCYPSLSSSAASTWSQHSPPIPTRTLDENKGLTRGMPLAPLIMHSVSPASIPLPPTPAVGPSRIFFSSSFTASTIPKESTMPKTPNSGASVTSFFGVGGSASKDNAEFLVIKGVERERSREEMVRKWCENWGIVKQIVRLKGSGDLIIQFREKETVKQITPQETDIPHVGTVTVGWTR